MLLRQSLAKNPKFPAPRSRSAAIHLDVERGKVSILQFMHRKHAAVGGITLALKLLLKLTSVLWCGLSVLMLNAAIPGTVVAWGDNSVGQTTVPGDAQGGVTAIAAGLMHTVAVKKDGRVKVWGTNNVGQMNVPAGLDGVIAVAAGANFSVALKHDGKLASWGENNYAQTNIPPGLGAVRVIACGDQHSLALLNDGTVTAISKR